MTESIQHQVVQSGPPDDQPIPFELTEKALVLLEVTR
jgi:hypothetical protein